MQMGIGNVSFSNNNNAIITNANREINVNCMEGSDKNSYLNR